MYTESKRPPVTPAEIWAANLPIEQRVLALTSYYGLQNAPQHIVFISHAKREGNGPRDTRAGNHFRSLVGNRATQWSTAAQIFEAEMQSMFPYKPFSIVEIPFSEWSKHQSLIKQADLVCASPYPSDIHYVAQIAQFHPDAPLLIGGAFATRNPSLLSKTLPQGIIVQGRMEGQLPYVFHKIQAGFSGVVNRKKAEVGPFDATQDYYTLKRLGKENTSNTRDNPAGVVVESILGCNERCTFCSILSHVENPRDPYQVVAELQKLSNNGVRYVLFADDNLSRNSPENLSIIFTAIKEFGMAWAGEGSRELLNHPELARLMGETNIGFLHGIDDLSESVQGAHSQKTRTPDEVIRDLEQFRKNGFLVFGSIVVGLDNHRYPDTFIKIRDQALKSPVPFIVQTAVPFPGTEFYLRANRGGRLLSEDLPDYNFGQIVYNPLHMSVEELITGTRWLQRELASPERVARIVTEAARAHPGKFLKHPRAFLSVLLLSIDNGFTGLTTQPNDSLVRESQSYLNSFWNALPQQIREILTKIS